MKSLGFLPTVVSVFVTCSIVFGIFFVHFLLIFPDFPLEILSRAVFDLVSYLSLIGSSLVLFDYEGCIDIYIVYFGI